MKDPELVLEQPIKPTPGPVARESQPDRQDQVRFVAPIAQNVITAEEVAGYQTAAASKNV